ncbi:MAG TPA: hypothetical protein VEC39_01445 [Vicinamibacterales bacterium]|nr:hypothetical protein [Vicinamibacterales bacterium]
MSEHRIGVIAAFIDGLMRVKRAPWLVVGTWASTLVMALPLTIVMQEQIAAHLQSSMAAAAAVRGINYDWWNEFLSQTSGAGASFVPAILGFAAVMQNVSGFVDGSDLPSMISLTVIMFLVLSLFLSGGILDRLARDHRVGAAGFFSACGTYFLRFLRLGVAMGVVYWALFGRYHPWLFDDLYPALTQDLTVERTAFLIRAGLYIAFALPLCFFNMLFDYTKVRAVVEDRRSMIAAIAAAWRFIRRQPSAVVALYLLDALLLLGVIGVYYAIAPPAAAPDAWAFSAGQLYIVLRVTVRLQFAASQTALFQGRLAHAGYVARPVPKWPDSPAAAAIGPQ